MAALKMIEPFAEKDLLYSLWVSYWDGSKKAYVDEMESMQYFIDMQREGIERNFEIMMRSEGITYEELSADIEYELKHKLKHYGEVNECGVPVLSDAEIVDYLMVDDFRDSDFDDGTTGEEVNDYLKRSLTPLLYYSRNPMSTYQASQLCGLASAFHDFLLNIGDKKDDGMRIAEDGIDIIKAMERPYQKWLNNERLDIIQKSIKELMLYDQ